MQNKIYKFMTYIMLIFSISMNSAIAGFDGETITTKLTFHNYGSWPPSNKVVDLGTFKIDPNIPSKFYYPMDQNTMFYGQGFYVEVSNSIISIVNLTHTTFSIYNAILEISESGSSKNEIIGIDAPKIVDASLSFDSRSVSIALYGAEFLQNTSTPIKVFFKNADIPPPIPEPNTYVMLIIGLGMIGFLVHRRRVR